MPTSVPIVPAPLPDCPAATMTIARYLARNAVKQDLQAQGVKLSQVRHCIIIQEANRYVDQYRDELVVEARRMIARSPELRKMAEQEAKRRRRTVR